jgi:hypothetical protein
MVGTSVLDFASFRVWQPNCAGEPLPLPPHLNRRWWLGDSVRAFGPVCNHSFATSLSPAGWTQLSPGIRSLRLRTTDYIKASPAKPRLLLRTHSPFSPRLARCERR